ncbi:hypothetical protein Pla110_22070 [Polystyrenella longa]|uniref:Helix-turn-helix domain protein n=1 Tax=Polystyrenella longa TaxID=2528007 RepID=A0A518CMM5_9PLAN|nr:helix-turn-helix domain-containing protein [Polystyrenella longa]QDU80477.1 hypothetical protein Pla110_22070 [Polystyrenella longa]
MSVEIRTKTIVSVAEMARMCRLSRARFYQLAKEGVFPSPLYRLNNKRPFYPEDLQEVCLEVRRRNCGVNGKPILFYSRGTATPTSKPKRVKQPSASQKYNELINDLASLGLTNVKGKDIEQAVGECFPTGINQTDESVVLQTVFLHLKRQDSTDNLG